ncbi:hypothetical protein DXC95_02635 [Parabacteroides sp. 20_3]|nr:hypothetical protein DXC95_02635 [Parabacteroides sp. 20_3]
MAYRIGEFTARTYHNIAAISGKVECHIRQFIALIVDTYLNGDCLNRNACYQAMRYCPLNIRHGNGASVVVRVRESLIHGEGRQLIS